MAPKSFYYIFHIVLAISKGVLTVTKENTTGPAPNRPYRVVIPSGDNKLTSSAYHKASRMYRNLHSSFNHIKYLHTRSNTCKGSFRTSVCFEEFLDGLIDLGGNSKIPDDKKSPSVKIV